MLYGTDMPSAERDKATDDLLSVVKAMGANLSPTIAGRVLELRDADHAAYVKALELIARFMPKESR